MALAVAETPREAREQVRRWQADGLSVGLVPTMGALHEGHLSLMRASVAENDRTVISIYVNPTQFGPDEDLDDYPRRLKADGDAAEEAGVDLIFAPTDEVMYPEGSATYVVQERLTERLCGASRPAHFRGVLTVVAKLFHAVPADRAYFGQKDFQQSVVIRRMVRDLGFPVEVRVMPTVREPDGLAMSSRNEYLSDDERRQALCLHRALCAAGEMFLGGQADASALKAAMREEIEREPDARIDYVDIVGPDDLESVGEVGARDVAVLAVFVGETRLIDNMVFGEAAGG